jgi:hypothetical protein
MKQELRPKLMFTNLWIWGILPQLGFLLGFSLWHIAIPVPVSEVTMFADQCSENLSDRGKLCANYHNGENIDFYIFWQKYMYNEAKYCTVHVTYIVNLISVMLDPGLFKQIRILVRTMAVRAMNFQSRSPRCGKIRRIWEPWFYIYWCATLWTVALKRPIFKRNMCSRTLL